MNKEIEKELYSFIVNSNLENALLTQLDDKRNYKAVYEWLGLE